MILEFTIIFVILCCSTIADGTQQRNDFELAVRQDLASRLGMDVSRVEILSVVGDSVVVAFKIHHTIPPLISRKNYPPLLPVPVTKVLLRL